MTSYGPYPGQEGPYAGQQQGYPPPPTGGYPGAPGFHPPPPQGAYPAPGYGPPPGQYPPPGYGPSPAQYPGFSPPPPGGDQGMYGSNYTGGEDPEVKGFGFSDKSIRRGFIRKVYSILTVQLAITLAFICWFVYHQPTKRYVQHHPAIFYASIAIVFVSMICIVCCEDVRRKAPTNYIFLLIFTLAESFVCAAGASTYDKQEVVLAIGITAAVCLGLTLFAFQTKWDFTMCGGILFVAVLILFLFGIICIFLPHGRIVTLVYASLGALIFSLYLIYDTQLMMGGKHKYSLSPEEYIFAALSLYIDVINIFIYILTIIGASRD